MIGVTLSIPNTVQRNLRTLAIQGLPQEVCGVIYAHNIIVQYPNTFCGDKCHGFDMEIDLQDDIRAIWHSHPSGPDNPSEDDKPCMELLASHGFTFPWLIVTPKIVTEWVCWPIKVEKYVEKY